MKVTHIALGGCLSAGQVRFGLTEDTGGHIAYVLGAARAQAARSDVESVEIVTRLFDDPKLGAEFACPTQIAGPKLTIRRLETVRRDYLSKEALTDEVGPLARVYMRHLEGASARPDVIHAHFADAAVLGRMAKRLYDIRLVYTPHSLAADKLRCMDGDAGPALRRRLARERAALAAADAVIVSSRDESERQILSYDADVCGRVHRIWPGVAMPDDASRLAAAAQALIDPLLDAPEKPMILAIARPVVRKNLTALARAYAESSALRDRANLVILAGQHGVDAENSDDARAIRGDLLAVANIPACRGRVAVPAQHDPAMVPGLYRLAARRGGVFVNPALHEPFGLTILEASSHGLPVVATRHGGPPDILARLQSGTSVDPRDPGRIGMAIVNYLDSPVVWATASRNARSNIGAFSWDAWAARALGVYRQAGRPRPAMPRKPSRLLACDMDDTLTGCRNAVRRFREWHARRDMPFVLSTGRSLSEARVMLSDWNLPEPDIFITAVGTEIHMRGASGRLMRSDAFRKHLDLTWDRDTLRDLIGRLRITAQADIEQRDWKLSYFGSDRDARYLRGELHRADLRARVISSHGRFIDVVPIGGGKAQALAFVAREFGLTLRDCIAAGDSGNDLDMLQAVGMPVVVGNALPELVDALGDRHAYRSDANFAGGVLDGIAHYSRAEWTGTARIGDHG